MSNNNPILTPELDEFSIGNFVWGELYLEEIKPDKCYRYFPGCVRNFICSTRGLELKVMFNPRIESGSIATRCSKVNPATTLRESREVYSTE
jgi:hypothetical protein